MENSHLRYFVAVAEELSFTRAANRLNTSQPQLSRYVQQLELELGTMLLDRTERQIKLTAAGSVFVNQARLILNQMEQAKLLAQRASRGEIGQLRIGLHGPFHVRLVVESLQVFLERHPDVHLTLNSMYALEQIEALQHSRIDVGIIRLPAYGPGLRFDTLFREPLLVVMSANHPLAKRNRIRLSDLANQPHVLFPRHLNPPLHDFIIGACHNAGFSPKIVHDAEDLYTRLALVGANLGVTLATASYQQIPTKGIVFRNLQPPVPKLEMALAFRSDDKLPLLPLFAEVVKKVFARSGYSAVENAHRK